MDALYEWLRVDTPRDLIWLAIGLVAQLMFSARFLVQWISSEREKKSVVPVSFWWLSLFGGAMLFIYGLERGEPVILLGQSFGIIVYARNLWLIYAQPAE
ncbi:MAG: lipid-A-disaccharide synthase N-terminal domain-containing protein [Rhodobacteraceae bacterium]|nr:lipid-A-disaccharide synthase N-terminal domain-containing protein [Paracoccaceae bacterium]